MKPAALWFDGISGLGARQLRASVRLSQAELGGLERRNDPASGKRPGRLVIRGHDGYGSSAKNPT
jgi:hypothetical protein